MILTHYPRIGRIMWEERARGDRLTNKNASLTGHRCLHVKFRTHAGRDPTPGTRMLPDRSIATMRTIEAHSQLFICYGHLTRATA
jgi:hypothetical protein